MKKAYEEKFVFHERSIDEKKINVHGFYRLCEAIFGKDPGINSVSLKELICEMSKLDSIEQEAIESRYRLYYKDIWSYPQLIGLKKDKLRRVEAKALRLLRHPAKSNNYIIDRMIRKKEEEIRELRQGPAEDCIKIIELGLSKRAYNALTRAGINTVDELEKIKDYVLISMPGIGKVSLDEIWQKVHGKPYYN